MCYLTWCVKVLCQRNRPQLRRIFHEYEEITGHSIEQAVENEFSGSIKDSLLQLVHCVRDPVEFLAARWASKVP